MPLLANKSRVQFLPDRAPYEYKLGRETEHRSLLGTGEAKVFSCCRLTIIEKGWEREERER